MLVCVLAMMAGSAWLLDAFKSHQRVGKPGLKLSNDVLKDPEGKPVGNYSVKMPDGIGNYRAESDPLPRMMLDALPPDTVFGQRRYIAPDGFWMQSTVVLMGTDRSSIHKPQFCLTGQGWTIVKSSPTSITMEKPYRYELPIMRLDASKPFRMADGKERTFSGVYLYWFVSGDQLTADHLERQWWMARDLLTKGVLQRWAYVTYFAPCSPGLEQITFERMKNFLIEAVPTFQEIQGPRASRGPAQDGVGLGRAMASRPPAALPEGAPAVEAR